MEVDLPALPRTGEQVLWCDDVPDGFGGTYRRLREYRVGRVDWTFSAEEPGDPLVLIRLEFLADVSGAR